ncbi:hypothetical protein CP532_5327 [Ophiocordyceps camponoti-leonardi (nom. inval.)]|nr:hypothetical protein CP532_5327 [Ophiocordyceps camponoti-leonardi (nom. inval.)]
MGCSSKEEKSLDHAAATKDGRKQQQSNKAKSCRYNGRKTALADLVFQYNKSKNNNHKKDRFEIGRGDSKHTKVTQKDPPTYVFHPSRLSPPAAEKRTGFLPQKPETDFGFGAFADIPAAARRAADLAREIGGNATLYLVHPTPNIVLDAVFGGYFVVGGILYDQVVGSISLSADLSDQYLGMLAAGLEMQSPYDEAFYTKNKAYKPENYDRYTFTKDVSINSLKTKEAAKAFMKTKGAAVGWRGDFPLFTPPEDSLSEWFKSSPSSSSSSSREPWREEGGHSEF